MTQPTSATLDDIVTLESIQRGDGDALTQWFRRYQAPLYAFVFFRVGNDPDLAADATQATFTTALQRLGDFDPQRGDMTNWLRYLSRNIIRGQLARYRRGVQLQTVWDRLDESMRDACQRIDSELLPDDMLQRKETCQLVEMVLANLPPQHREVLLAKYVDNLSLDAIAKLRETTTDAVKSMLRRARSSFRDHFLAVASMEMSDV